MQYLIQLGMVTMRYRYLESMSPECQQIFRFMMHFHAQEMINNGCIYIIERD